MAETPFNSSTNTALIQTVLAKQAMVWARDNCYFSIPKGFSAKQKEAMPHTSPDPNKEVGMMENGTNAIFTIKDELKKQPGETIQVRILAPLTGEGAVDDQTLEGNEEELQYYVETVTVHQRRNASMVKGMSERRTKVPVRTDARDNLALWYSEKFDRDCLLSLSGLGLAIGTPAVNVVTASAPSTNRKWFGGQTTGGVLESTGTHALIDSATNNIFGTAVISAMKRKAQMAGAGFPKIRPLLIKGQPWYVMFIHPYQSKALKNEAAWKSAQQYANLRGETNPLFSGALGVFDGVIIHEYDKIETRLGAGGTDPTEYFDVSTDVCYSGIYVARALLCGCQAGLMGNAQEVGWEEQRKDYGNTWGVAIESIWGAQKTVFNSEDYGVIAVNTAIVPD